MCISHKTFLKSTNSKDLTSSVHLIIKCRVVPIPILVPTISQKIQALVSESTWTHVSIRYNNIFANRNQFFFDAQNANTGNCAVLPQATTNYSSEEEIQMYCHIATKSSPWETILSVFYNVLSKIHSMIIILSVLLIVFPPFFTETLNDQKRTTTSPV